MVPIKNLTELKNATVVLEDYGEKPAIEIEVLAGNDTDQSLLEFEYEITSFDEFAMTIQFNFTNAKEVSINRLPDNLRVTFWAWNLFVDTNGTTFEQKQIRLKSMPTQIPLGQISILKSIGKVAEVGTTSSLGVNFLTNLIIGGSLNLLWSMLENQ